MSTDGRDPDRLCELGRLVGEFAAELEWQRQLGVMIACWPYALRRPMPQIPTQRRPSRTERQPARPR